MNVNLGRYQSCKPGGAEVYFLTHHKCASSWLAEYLSRTCEINNLGFARTHAGNLIPTGEAQITLFTNADYSFLKDRIGSGIHIVRNPFDLLLSAYYSHLSTHGVKGWPELAVQREILKSVKREKGILLTIPFVERADFYTGTCGPFLSMRTWNYDDVRFSTVRMEDIVTDVGGTIGKALQKHFGSEFQLPEAEEFRFERFANNRRPGQRDNTSHYRTGVHGKWRHELPKAAVTYVRFNQSELVERFYPEDLV